MSNKYANLDGSKKIREEYTKINAGFDAVEADINAVNGRVDTIITTPIDGEAAAQEVVDARSGFSTIGARMTNIETDLISHKADNASHNDIREQINSLAPQSCKVGKTTNQSIPSSILTILSFDTEIFDVDNMFDKNISNTRIICKAAGVYAVYGNVVFAANTTQIRVAEIAVNGVSVAFANSPPPSAGNGTSIVISSLVKLNINDYVELKAFQPSGGALDVLSISTFGMVKVG